MDIMDQKAHDIGIAFASVKLSALTKGSASNRADALSSQFLDFMTNYSYAYSEFVIIENERKNH